MPETRRESGILASCLRVALLHVHHLPQPGPVTDMRSSFVDCRPHGWELPGPFVELCALSTGTTPAQSWPQGIFADWIIPRTIPLSSPERLISFLASRLRDLYPPQHFLWGRGPRPSVQATTGGSQATGIPTAAIPKCVVAFKNLERGYSALHVE